MERKSKSTTKINSDSLKNKSKPKNIQKSINDNTETPLPEEWNNNSVLAQVFQHLKFKDLINLSNVCKKWNQLINPMIYKSLKISRYRYIANKYHNEDLSRDDKFAAEINACIENNIKHIHLIQEFRLRFRLPQNLAQQFFGVFCYLSKFTIFNIRTSQDIILTCLKPLKYLKEMNLEKAIIEEINSNRFVFEPVKLPQSLTKMQILNVRLIKNAKLIKETLCSHTNLKEFVFHGLNNTNFLTPFKTHYPTLQKFSYIDHYHPNSVTHTYRVIESNPQLTELHIESNELNSHIVTLINSHLTNLTELTLKGSKSKEIDTSKFIRFMQPMKLTKLILYWNDLTIASVDSILANSPQLKDLHLSVDYNYTSWASIIRQRCKQLTQLTYNATHLRSVRSDETNLFGQFFETVFSQNQYQCNQTLKSLNFCHFHLNTLRPEYLDQFPNLQIVNFYQGGSNLNREEIQDLRLYLKQFRGWKLKLLKRTWSINGFLYKPNSKVVPFNLENYENW